MLTFLIYVFIFVGVLLLSWSWFASTRYYKLCRKIPGPTPYPIFGNTIPVFCRKELTMNFFIKYTSGYFPITRLLLLHICGVLLHDADHVNKVLKSTKTISKGAILCKFFRRFFGRSIISEPRDQWKKLRQIMNPTFSVHILKSYVGIFSGKCGILVDILKIESEGKAFDISHYLKMAALDMISQTSLGVDMRVQKENLTDYVSVIEEGKKLVQTCVVNPLYWIDFIYKHVTVGRRLKKVRSLMESFASSIIEKKMKCYSKNEGELSNLNENTARNKKLGFLDNVLGALHQTKENITTEELLAQVNILAAAGMDTTAFTLSVCLMLLGLYKDVQDKVVEEIRDIFEDDVNRAVEYEDLQRMSYTEMVLKATMRLFPVSFLVARHADEDIEIGGYTIPAGTYFLLSQFMLHRNPKYFPNPLMFDPERFSPENCYTRHPHCYIPFLTGPRMCIGYQYAMLQMKTVLSHILRNFEVLPFGTREQMEELDMSFMLSLKHGYNVRMRVRT